MKYTNESLKQQASEDFTNINEDEPFVNTGSLATQYEKYEKLEQENYQYDQSTQNKWSNHFESSKQEFYYGFGSDNSSSSKIIKISCLSSMKPTVSSHKSSQYNIGDMSPGLKFQSKRVSKISSAHMDQFLREKHKSSNSCDNIERKTNKSLFQDQIHW